MQSKHQVFARQGVRWTRVEGGGSGESSGTSTLPGGGGGIFRAGENMNLQMLARQNLCHFLK